jgi:hypothetical protein
MNAPVHSIGPQTHILGSFVPFRYCTNLGAKRAELEHLMHKFVQRCRVGIFCNERPQSTPLDPKLMFSGVSNSFATTRMWVQNGPNRSTKYTSWCNEVVSEFFAMNAPDPPHWTSNSCFGAFQTISLMHELKCKMVEREQSIYKFVQRSRVVIFCNGRTRSTPLDPKLMFWDISDRFVTARTLVQNGPNWCL